MKYLCLIYEDERNRDDLSDGDVDARVKEMVAFTNELRKSGRYVACERLQSARAATTVRNRDGKISVMDGPFAETKEQLGGFYLIEARDLNEAIRVASQLPAARWGSIEIRPIWAAEHSQQGH